MVGRAIVITDCGPCDVLFPRAATVVLCDSVCRHWLPTRNRPRCYRRKRWHESRECHAKHLWLKRSEVADTTPFCQDQRRPTFPCTIFHMQCSSGYVETPCAKGAILKSRLAQRSALCPTFLPFERVSLLQLPLTSNSCSLSGDEPSRYRQ